MPASAKDRNRQAAGIREMFSAVARRYDFLNHFLSANLDRHWRNVAAGALAGTVPSPVLDLCGGTGDLSLALLDDDPHRTVVCCDFSHAMLVRATHKLALRGFSPACPVVEADALRLPFADGAFGAVTIAFGVRNLVDREAGFLEMKRVLRPGGRLVVLEFSDPQGPIISRLYRIYLNRLLPRMGQLVSRRREAYDYLARTIASFPGAVRLAQEIRDAGFESCEFRRMTSGIVAIHLAQISAESPLSPRRAAPRAPLSVREDDSPPAGTSPIASSPLPRR